MTLSALPLRSFMSFFVSSHLFVDISPSSYDKITLLLRPSSQTTDDCSLKDDGQRNNKQTIHPISFNEGVQKFLTTMTMTWKWHVIISLIAWFIKENNVCVSRKKKRNEKLIRENAISFFCVQFLFSRRRLWSAKRIVWSYSLPLWRWHSKAREW